MKGWDAGASLPSSHIFLTAAFGRWQKTVALPRWSAALIAVALGLGGLWGLGCTIYVVGHDSLLAAAMQHERDLQYSYEDRIESLQRQLDKTLSQHAQLERTVGTRLDVLAAQAGELRRQSITVASLANSILRLAPSTSGQQAAAPDRTTAPSPAHDHDAQAESLPSERTADRLATLTESIGTLATEQQTQLARLQHAAADREGRFRTAISEAGLSLSRFAPKGGEAVGGPFVPLDARSVSSPFDRASLTLQATLDQLGRIETAVAHVPLAMPLDGAPELTSPFGARTDPFLGRPALHTGIDLRDEMGTNVRATAPGRVVSAGVVNGYGIMVEIDHGAGLSTRYAHLSAATVVPGEAVGKGETIGRVGATGRATGPHLHYETRIDGEPVDPMRFLVAGHHLLQDTAP